MTSDKSQQQLISKKMMIFFMFAPILLVSPILLYMEYMLHFDPDVEEFRLECESKGGKFTFDIPKILMCDEDYVDTSPIKKYVGEIQISISEPHTLDQNLVKEDKN